MDATVQQFNRGAIRGRNMQELPQPPIDVSAHGPALGVATSLSEIAALVSEWEDIVQRSDELDLFLSPSWMMLWYKIVMSTHSEPAVVWVRAPDGRLAGILPLVRNRRYFGPIPRTLYESAGEEIVCGDHLGLVTSLTDFTDVYGMVRDWLLAQAADGALVRLVALDAENHFATSLQRDVEKRAKRWRQIMPDIAPRLSLPTSYEAYEKLLNPRRRRWIRANWRRLDSDYGATLHCNDELASLNSVLDEWFALHDRSWASRGRHTALESNRLREFLRQFCQEAAQQGWLRLYQLRVKEQLVAGLIVFHRKGRAYSYQLGWAPEFADYGIGELLLVHSIRVAINERLSVFDFLRGSQPYKFWLRAQPHPMTGVEFACGGPGRQFFWAGEARERLVRVIRSLQRIGRAVSNTA